MEGLVNYSSEDEQDDKSYRMAAERGSYLKRASATKADDTRRRPDSSGGGGSGKSHTTPSYGSGSNSAGAGGGHNYKDEDSHRYKSPSKTSTHSNSNRTSSQHHNDKEREGRDMKDNREYRDNRDSRNSPRDNRDNRDFNNGNRNDNRNDRFNRSREFNRDQRRDHNNFRDTRRPRDDDRNYRGNGNQNRYASSSFSSPQNKDRFKNSRFNDRPTNQRNFQQRSRDERSDGRSERFGRKQRSPDSRSPSPTSSHTKRHSSSRNDSERTRKRGRNSESHSRSRSRSRSSTPRSRKRSPPSPTNTTSRERVSKPIDQARSTALDLERKLSASELIAPEREIRPLLRHTEAVLSLPLNDTPKPPTVIAVAPTSSAEPSVIQLPSYYNPSVINPNKYAEQVQKRKLIWGAKKAEDTSTKWGHAQFSQDSDGKVASKFMRLMGIKGGSGAKSDTETPAAEPADTDKKPDVKSREQMFTSMEQQYEVARQVTHTMRGVGLGFSSQPRPY